MKKIILYRKLKTLLEDMCLVYSEEMKMYFSVQQEQSSGMKGNVL